MKADTSILIKVRCPQKNSENFPGYFPENSSNTAGPLGGPEGPQ